MNSHALAIDVGLKTALYSDTLYDFHHTAGNGVDNDGGQEPVMLICMRPLTLPISVIINFQINFDFNLIIFRIYQQFYRTRAVNYRFIMSEPK